jgi:hypothetical protein
VTVFCIGKSLATLAGARRRAFEAPATVRVIIQGYHALPSIHIVFAAENRILSVRVAVFTVNGVFATRHFLLATP